MPNGDGVLPRSAYILSQHFHTKTPSAQCLLVCKTAARIGGGGCDPGIEGFLCEMDVLTKVLNAHYG